MGEVTRQCAAMMGTGGMMGMGGMGVMGLMWVLTIAALIALAVVGVIWLQRRREPFGIAVPAQSARQVLDRRYATGELDRGTYLQMRSDLELAG